MKKILIVSTVSRQFYLFEQANIEVLKSLGYEVHGAANFNDKNTRLEKLEIIHHHFDIQRSPFSLKNIKAYKQLKIILKNTEFDLIHCHSPMGGVLTRLATRKSISTPVIYTAHGFHFYDGSPLKNWVIYYNVEKYLSKYTDTIVTINEEDFKIAKTFKSKNTIIVPGIGVDSSKFDRPNLDRDKKRKELGISEETVVLLSIGEMIERKNYLTAIKAIAKIENNNYIYMICGTGKLEDNLKDKVRKFGLEEKVKFLGFRDDIDEICAASDIFLFPSYQEGLPVSVMEAMSAGLPVIASKIRGNTDLIQHGKGGFLHDPEDYLNFSKSISTLVENKRLRTQFGLVNKKIVKKYDISVVKSKMKNLYSNITSVT